MKDKEHILGDWDCVKVITSLLVVLGHSTFFYTEQAAIRPLISSSVLDFITKYIYSFHMPLFIAVSGAIYFYGKRTLGKYKQQIPFIKNKILRLLIPYFFFATCIIIPLIYYMKIIDVPVVNYYIENILLGKNPRYLWYVLALFNISIIFNFFEKYIFKLNFIFNFIFFFSLFLIASFFPSFFVLKATMAYLLFFFLGYKFQCNKTILMSILRKTYVVVFLIFVSISSFLFSIYIDDKDGFIFKMTTKLLGFLSALSGGTLFYLLATYLLTTKFITTGFYTFISKGSYGLYLFHPMIIYLVYYFTKNLAVNPYVLCLLACIISLSLSGLLIILFRKLNLYILIGESKPKQ